MTTRIYSQIPGFMDINNTYLEEPTRNREIPVEASGQDWEIVIRRRFV